MNCRSNCIVALFALSSLGQADEFVGPYNAFQAGADAAMQHEAKKLQAIGLQLGTIDQMKWYSGIAAGGHGIYYDRPSLDSIYAYGPRGSYGSLRASRWLGYEHVFEPWPYVPGDIWGYRWDATVRQPIGRRSIQTGPNRWESHPVYADELPATTPQVERIRPVRDVSPAVKPSRPSMPRQF